MALEAQNMFILNKLGQQRIHNPLIQLEDDTEWNTQQDFALLDWLQYVSGAPPSHVHELSLRTIVQGRGKRQEGERPPLKWRVNPGLSFEGKQGKAGQKEGCSTSEKETGANRTDNALEHEYVSSCPKERRPLQPPPPLPLKPLPLSTEIMESCQSLPPLVSPRRHRFFNWYNFREANTWMPRHRERPGDDWKSWKYLQVLTKQIDDGLVIYSLKKSIFLSFQVFHIGVFFHPERDLKIRKLVNWKVFQGYWFERKLEHGKRQSQPLLINKCWWYQNFYC